MANVITKKLKKFGRYTWELFKNSILPALMYFCAGSILMMLVFRSEKIVWNGSKIAWAVVCILGAAAYNALACWANGGMQYEMLVSGNVKRSTYDAYGNEYKMSTHKEAKEYRVWKGFVIGAMTAIYPIVFGIIFGCKQGAIDSGTYGKGFAVFMLIGFFLSGWSILPFYCMNAVGISVSYFLSILFALIPILVSGGTYIGGAYAKRNKAIRQQYLAEQAAKAEEARKQNKKINYGALPRTKPKKRK